MKMENRFLSFLIHVGLVVVFIIAGGLSTLLLWLFLDITLMCLVKDNFIELVCFSIGMFCPVVSIGFLWQKTQKLREPLKRRLRVAGTIGLILAVILEAAVFIPLLILGFVYRGVRM